MRLPLLGLALLLLGVGFGLTPSPESDDAPATPGRAPSSDALDPLTLSGAAGARRAAVARSATPAPAAAIPERPTSAERPARRYDEVLLGLRWLAAHQQADGSWAPEADPRACRPEARGEFAQPPLPARADFGLAEHRVGVTSFALLAFLGAGYTHRGDHDFTRVMKHGLLWLRAQQQYGFVRTTTHRTWAFDHALATWALGTAYGMTESPLWKAPALEALEALARLRGPDVWTYGLTPGLADESLTLWALLPLLTARALRDDAVRRGKPVEWTFDERALDAGLAWLERLTQDAQRPESMALPPAGDADLLGSEPRACFALALLVRAHACQDLKEPRFEAARRWLDQNPPSAPPSGATPELLHAWAGTHAAFVAGGAAWKAWDGALAAALPPLQGAEGAFCDYRGSWAPSAGAPARGGRVLATALGVLCLEIHYRYDTQLLPCR